MDIQIKQVCHWTFEPEGYYETECGSANVFNEGGPDENAPKRPAMDATSHRETRA